MEHYLCNQMDIITLKDGKGREGKGIRIIRRLRCSLHDQNRPSLLTGFLCKKGSKQPRTLIM